MAEKCPKCGAELTFGDLYRKKDFQPIGPPSGVWYCRDCQTFYVKDKDADGGLCKVVEWIKIDRF